MKFYIYITLLILISIPNISYSSSYDAIIHLKSFHSKPSSDYGLEKPWNEENYGLGLKYTMDNKHSISIGRYNNSINVYSNYAFYNIPLIDSEYTSFNVKLGVVSGYYDNVIPTVLPEVLIKLSKNVGVSFVFIPKIPYITPAVIGVSLEFKVF